MPPRISYFNWVLSEVKWKRVKNRTISVLPDTDFWTFSSFHRQKIVSASQSVKTLTDYAEKKTKKIYIGFDMKKSCNETPPHFKRYEYYYEILFMSTEHISTASECYHKGIKIKKY